MTVQFDTLTFAKRLTAAGEKVEVAEAHAMAFKDFVMDTIATKADIAEVRTELRTEVGKLSSEIAVVRTEMADLRTELKFDIAASEERVRQELRQETTGLRHEIAGLRTDMGTLWLKLTISMGGMMLAGGSMMFGLLRFFPR